MHLCPHCGAEMEQRPANIWHCPRCGVGGGVLNTPGTALVGESNDGCIFPSNGLAFLGDGTPEHIFIPTGTRVIPHEEAMRLLAGEQTPGAAPKRTINIVPLPVRYATCNGPDCTEQYNAALWPPKRWRTVSNRESERWEFCSFSCMAAWLAGELAKEESKR